MLFRLEAEGVVPLPGRSSVYRALVRHGLIEPVARRRRKADYKRWERARPMELWQMDVVGGVMLAVVGERRSSLGSMTIRGLWFRLMWCGGRRLGR